MMNNFFFYSGVPPDGVMPCQRYVTRACGHEGRWLFSRLNDPDVDWLYISINRPQLGGMRASTRSPPMTGWSEWWPNDLMVILFRVCKCHMPKEAEPSLLNKVGTGGQAVVCLTAALVIRLVYCQWRHCECNFGRDMEGIKQQLQETRKTVPFLLYDNVGPIDTIVSPCLSVQNQRN